MYEKMIQKYKDLYEKPLDCEPLVQVYFPVKHTYSIGEALTDPAKMFTNQMETMNARLAVGDDFLPALRADFGTAQIAAMYGCPMRVTDDSEPCCNGHILNSAEEARNLQKPQMTDGWMPKVDEFQRYFLAHMPEGIVIQHPDVQGPFNSAHLIRGNDILFDFYDDPDNVHLLLDKVADFMVDWIRYTKREISNDDQWFYDRGGLWRGGARLCNCSLQFVSPEIYREHIMRSDDKFLKAVGLGRVHYCGSYREIIDDLFRLEYMTNLEVDCQFHDVIETCEKAPENVSVMFCDWSLDPGNGEWYHKIMRGEIPQKKNIVFQAKADSIEEAKEVYYNLKNQLCK